MATAKNSKSPKNSDIPADLLSRTPPASHEAENSVLGCIMLVNDTIDQVLDLLRPEQFYDGQNRRIFATIVEMYEDGERGIDAVTLKERLDKKGELDAAGGVAKLLEIMETVPHAAHVEYYAKIVQEKYLQRQLIYVCNDILKDTYHSGDDVNDVLARAEQKMFAISEQQESIDKIDMRSILLETWDRINERRDQEGTTSGLHTGFIGLNELTSGYQPSELIILAARPSMGKTAFVCNSTLAVAGIAKAGVLLFSLEQSKSELAERLLCIHAKVDGHKVRQGDLSDLDNHALLEASNELSQYPIFVDDQAGRTMTQIAAISRRLKRQFDIGMVIIDYLQLIEAEDKNQPREQQISSITRRLKFLAKDLHIPVIALAQLNRGVEQREDKRPRLSDLRESGAIEQDADIVMFLHRPEAYDPEDRPGEAFVIVAKNRSGPIGDAHLTWVRQQLRFVDYSPINEPEGGWVGDEF
ncbi:MAG: replicative DNA helicase [Rubinisphaera brasiliensis]|uniref:Replicative DNA helicase n=1 Tax=Rubinisphaera brasiliensis (strain ATCC 49424 / DSM 5305 / JCM 21570 / IAM 15109 / NBRC 103401 / IFAM 1448) TaxID=756272 RepID=F0SN39_RUBBR|nr:MULTISPECIES: replicative DNA helicase [Rubinisphaera]ADY61068.1 primary replicative DNA helicase [Rubinisphaera brasiliensis DSM 5305]